MDIFKLMRDWFNWSFENPEKIKPIHSAIFFFAIEHCNRLAWKDKFGFPTQMAMEAIGIRKWDTYKKGFNDLVEWGFITEIEKSKNQYSSCIISIGSAYPKNGKALEKARLKHSQKHGVKQGESTGDINIHSTKNNIHNTYEETNVSETSVSIMNKDNIDKIKKREDIDLLISNLKQQADILGISYDKKQERNFGKHIMTAKEYGEFCEKIGLGRIEFATNIMVASDRIKFWKGACAGPMSIYQNYSEVYNLTKSKQKGSEIINIT